MRIKKSIFYKKSFSQNDHRKDRINGVTQEGHKRIKFRTKKNMF